MENLKSPDAELPKEVTTEVTRAQLSGGSFVTTLTGKFQLYSTLPATYSTYRKIAKQPTVALAMEFAIAPIVANDESVESDEGVPDEIVDFIDEQWDRVKFDFKTRALEDLFRFGWVSFEKVFEQKDGRWRIAKLKALMPDITTILINIENGSPWGIRQPIYGATAYATPETGLPMELNMDYCMILSWRPEGSGWFGTSIVENIRSTYNGYEDADDGARRYDKYISGSHWLVMYPDGVVNSYNGVTNVSCAEVAAGILQQLESSGAISIPQPIAAQVGSMNAVNPGWSVELLSDATPRQPSFIDRLKYFDLLFARGLGITERSLFEGSSSGSNAESSTHTDSSLVITQLKHEFLCNQINDQLVNQLIRLNFGDEYVGKVRISPAPLADNSKRFMQDLVKQAVMSNPGALDLSSMLDELNLPQNKEVADADPTEVAAQNQQALAKAKPTMQADMAGRAE